MRHEYLFCKERKCFEGCGNMKKEERRERRKRGKEKKE